MDRVKKFDDIFAGVQSEPITVQIAPPALATKIIIGGAYVCDNCPPADPGKLQMLNIYIVGN